MIEFTDRYKALGIPYPDPKTMCKGQCEGTGVYPEQGSCGKNCQFIARLWSRIKHMEWWYWKSLFEKCDGWHFIKCADCNGTGKKPAPGEGK